MNAIIDWAGRHARMVMAFIALTLIAGTLSYTGLPKEGDPDIEIPGLFVSVPFPGISAQDSERLVIRPMESEMADLEGLKSLSATAAENYAGLWLEFEFGWDKSAILADVRDRMNRAEAEFPAGAESYSINEFNFSQFPIIIVQLTGDVPERTLVRAARAMQDALETLEPVLEATLTGFRDEMVEVIIDPLRLETYNLTAGELISIIRANNQLIAAGEVETAQGSYALKIPGAFARPDDIHALPVKTNGDRVVTLGDLAEVRMTFADRTGTARYNGDTTVALQVVKRKGFNVIDTAALVRDAVAAEYTSWPDDMRAAISVGTSNDRSVQVTEVVSQLEGAVLTAVALVMIVILGSLGIRSALLVGFAIPTSFLLAFILLGLFGVTISNIVMFALILAVGILVDGAIVVVEYADRRLAEGAGQMQAYTDAAKRLFWPITSSTATTLCAFLPMLFWPGVAGEFMGMLPVTIITVLTASLLVTLIYVPVMGGVTGRFARVMERASALLRAHLPLALRLGIAALAAGVLFVACLQLINPGFIFGGVSPRAGWLAHVPGGALFLVGTIATSIAMGALRPPPAPPPPEAGESRNLAGRLTHIIVRSPISALAAIGAVMATVAGIFLWYGAANNGTTFMEPTEPDQAIIYISARGNLSLAEKDALVNQAETLVRDMPGVESIFAFAGDGGISQNTAGASGPLDTIGQIQIELAPWAERSHDPDLNGDVIMARIQERLATLPGLRHQLITLTMGPAASKPVHLRLKGEDWDDLIAATESVRARFEATPGLNDIEDTLPLPGIDWRISVDVEAAGRFGTDVSTVGGMVQLITRGILLDTMRVAGSDTEIEIRARLPEADRIMATLDDLKLRSAQGLVPLSHFITREPVARLGEINRIDQMRYFDIKADINPGLRTDDGRPLTANEHIAQLTPWLAQNTTLPEGVTFEWTGDFAEEAESTAFLSTAFIGAMGLMFIILLAQFNSFYNSVLVLLAVVLSTAGVLVGMLVMGQTFSVIMTGTGIVALAGIVVNNNIILIDTYQEYSAYMPRLAAISRTVNVRMRPVLLTTITTMAGLAPMMYGVSLDFVNGGYSIDSPAAAFWKQLATAVVFGLGIATVLTLVFTPAMLALRVWIAEGALGASKRMQAWAQGPDSPAARKIALAGWARRTPMPDSLWPAADADEPDTPRPASDRHAAQ